MVGLHVHVFGIWDEWTETTKSFKFYDELRLLWNSVYILYIFTSPLPENKKFVHIGRLFLPSRPVGYSLPVVQNFVSLMSSLRPQLVK